MPRKGGRLTPQERTAAKVFADTGSVGFAGFKAGYKHLPTVSAALERSAVQAEIREIQLARLHNDLLPLAMDTIQQALTEPTVPWGSKMVASKIVLDRAYGPGKEGERKDPSEMTAEELQAALDKVRRELADRAKPIVEISSTMQPDSVFD